MAEQLTYERGDRVVFYHDRSHIVSGELHMRVGTVVDDSRGIGRMGSTAVRWDLGPREGFDTDVDMCRTSWLHPHVDVSSPDAIEAFLSAPADTLTP